MSSACRQMSPELSVVPKQDRRRRGMAESEEQRALMRPVVSSNTYEWLKYQDEPHYDVRTEHSLNTIDSIGRWTTRLWNDAASHVSGSGTRQTPIEYSVFQPSIKAGPVPPALETRAQFDAVVEDCVRAISEEHFEIRRIDAGSSGSYFVYGSLGSNDSIKGVFKPKDEEPYGPFSPKWTKWLHRTFFPCFFGRSCLIPNLGYVCEAGASLLDRRLRLGLVPHTEIISLSSTSFYDARNQWLCGFRPRVQNKIGSFQLFVNGFVSAEEFLNRYPLPSMYRDHVPHPSETNGEFHWNTDTLKQFRLQLEKLIILDYIMRNTDRGLDNWMVKLARRQTSGVAEWDIKLAAIDNGLFFPWKHPDEWRSFPYGWLFLPVSLLNMPFSSETREHFLPILLNTNWWEQSHSEFTDLFQTDSEFKANLWKKQWSVLKGQAFNVVETLKDPRCGPLELVKRTPCLVLDGLVEYMFYPTQETPLTLSLAESLPKNASPLIVGSLPQRIQEPLAQPQHVTTQNQEEQLSEQPERRTVIIERLEICNNKPPLFTWW